MTTQVVIFYIALVKTSKTLYNRVYKNRKERNMYLIVGLGNPEEEYAKTRHNMGFDVINKLAENQGIKLNKTKMDAIYGKGEIAGEKVILVKPQTYMNLSGVAIRQYQNFYKVPEENIIVVYDDLDIEAGILKIRKQGGPGTHNGMKSVVHELQSQNFPRIRIGIGEPAYKHDLLNYILTKIPQEDYTVLEKAIFAAAEAIPVIIEQGIDTAMNQYN